jgi:hypothetical protein
MGFLPNAVFFVWKNRKQNFLFLPGKCWMDALELALRCSSLLMRTMTRDSRDTSLLDNTSSSPEGATFLSPLRQQMNESDCEKHFKGFGE